MVVMPSFKDKIDQVKKKYLDDKKGPPQSKLTYLIYILIRSVKGFIDDRGFDKASILTYYSLLSIVPLLAIGFWIGQELNFEDQLAEQIKNTFKNQPEIADKIIEFSKSTLKQTKGGLIASLGLLVLIWTVFKMIGNIAINFDEIWKLRKEPTIMEQLRRYVPMIFIFPVFIVASNGMIIFLSTKAILVLQSVTFLKIFFPVVELILNLLPYAVIWLMFTFLYIFLPNTQVNRKAGILAGIIAGILTIGWQWVYVTFQVNASSYGAVYGAFAAIPLFLIWLNYNWLIILFGTELSYQIQKAKS